jgi:membrane-bound serine protease (ClpP class)
LANAKRCRVGRSPAVLRGVVEVGNGRWRARTNRATPVRAGDPFRVAAIDGITLEIEPLEGAARDYRERRGRDKRSD